MSYNYSCSQRYSSVQNELKSVFPNVPVIMEDMPDPYVARETIWIPFIIDKVRVVF